MRFWRSRSIGLAALAAGAIAWTSASMAEQKVVIYSSNDDTLHKLVFAAFTKETGIAVEPISAGSGVVMKRIQTEKDRPGGDIVWGVSRSLLDTNKQYFSAYLSKNHDATPAEFRELSNLWIGNNLHLLVILQNTKVLPEDPGPQDVGRSSGSQMEGQDRLYRSCQLGLRVFHRHHARRPFRRWRCGLVQGQGAACQHQGAQSFLAGVPGRRQRRISARHLARICRICLGCRRGAGEDHLSRRRHDRADGRRGIIKGGPNLDAAKAFVDYINRKDVREMIIKDTFRRPARQDLDLSKLPGNMPALSSLKLLPTTRRHGRRARAATLEKIKDIVQETR